jgi:TIR domain
LDREIATHPAQRGSVGQVVEKGYLASFITGNPDFEAVLHFVPATHILTVEDPQFVFFLRNLGWNKFAERVGYLNIRFASRYDFALSFAGADRPIARMLFDLLTEAEFEVFYDENEQSRILAENIEDYLAPIYRSEASYVICLLSPEYPKRIWTKFESEHFRQRFGEKSVIPIWFATSPPGMFDESSRVGGIIFDPVGNQAFQLARIVDLLKRKVAEHSFQGQPAAPMPANSIDED